MQGLYNTTTKIQFGLGSFPGRKQLCFFFQEENQITLAGYVPARKRLEVEALWEKLISESLRRID